MTATFGAVFATLYAAHIVGDHWVQTQGQCASKGKPGWVGRRACLAHVSTYTLTTVLALLAVVWRTGMDLDTGHVVVGLLVSGGSHYVADRRTPLRWCADRLGKDPAWLERGGGLYALDQAWHIGFLFLAALVIV